MASSRKPRPKTRTQMRKLVEEIVLTEEDEKILDSVWDKMRRELLEKRRREKAQQRKKAAGRILDMARKNPKLLEELLQEMIRG
jgi:hypothetical protein